MPKGRRHFKEMPGACGLRPCARTHQKRPCATLSRSVGRGTNTAAYYRSSFLLIQLSGRISVGRAGCGADLAGCAFPPGYYPFGGVDRPAPEAFPKKGIADGLSFIWYYKRSLILCSCLLIVSVLYIHFPENISLFPLISWFVLYLILQAFTYPMFLSTNSLSIVYTFPWEYIFIPSHIVVCPLFNITSVHLSYVLVY